MEVTLAGVIREWIDSVPAKPCVEVNHPLHTNPKPEKLLKVNNEEKLSVLTETSKL